MELGPKLDSVHSLYLHSGEPLDAGLLSMLARKQPEWRAIRTGARRVFKPLGTPSVTLTTSTQSWTRFSDSKVGTYMWNAYSSNAKDTGCFAKPATPKLRNSKGK